MKFLVAVVLLSVAGCKKVDFSDPSSPYNRLHLTMDTVLHVACYRYEDGPPAGCIKIDSTIAFKASQVGMQ